MRSLLLILVATASIVATAPAADGDRGGQRQELQRNRTLWAHQHIRNYRFRLRVRCFCPSARHSVIVTVRDGRPHGATGFQKQLDTFPEMFAAIGRALDDPKAGTVTVRYNARRGFPAHRVDRPDQERDRRRDRLDRRSLLADSVALIGARGPACSSWRRRDLTGVWDARAITIDLRHFRSFVAVAEDGRRLRARLGSPGG
jgi:hypothetical protein